MANTIDRRGEAHLWLALEEALVAARRSEGGATAVWDVRRRFREVAAVLTAVGAVEPRRASCIVGELDDAMTVRGWLAPGAFQGREPPPNAQPAGPPAAAPTSATRAGDGWLEAEIEHHLDLVVDLTPDHHGDIGTQVLANLRPQVRALLAVGALRTHRRLDDLAATLRAAGYTVDDESDAERGEVDRGWLSFLRSKPGQLRTDHAPTRHKAIDVDLGSVAGTTAKAVRVSWSTDVLEIEVDAPNNGLLPDDRWRASAFDDSGQLHLGQAGQRDHAAATLVFRLRPGLRDNVSSFSLRITCGATRLDERVSL